LKKLWCSLKEAFKGFGRDGVFTMAAAMAFFAVLSLAPLLILLVTIGGLLGPDLKQGLIERVQTAMGPQAGAAIGQLLEQAGAQRVAMTFSAMAGIVTTLFGATVVMVKLQKFLNSIFGVELKKGFIFNWIYKRLMSLLMLIGIGVLLVASVVFSSLLSRLIPQGGWVTPVVNLIVNLLLFTLIFMVMFTVLPDVKISWKTTFIGGLITALLFVAGQYGISRYLATKGSSSVYGAAGFMIILLLWIYYTGMIVLFGAELTRAYLVCFGKMLEPSKFARWQSGEEEKQRETRSEEESPPA
jgi:membrane protein